MFYINDIKLSIFLLIVMTHESRKTHQNVSWKAIFVLTYTFSKFAKSQARVKDYLILDSDDLINFKTCQSLMTRTIGAVCLRLSLLKDLFTNWAEVVKEMGLSISRTTVWGLLQNIFFVNILIFFCILILNYFD